MLEISIGALVLGLAGSLHCAGMCGPIALALPLGDRRWAGKTFGSLLYNLGRALTYAVMGLAFGLLGQGMALAGLQQGVSIFAGAFMLLWVLVPWVQTKTQRTEATIAPWVGRLKQSLAKFFSRTSYKALFSIGLLNGFIPCGLVYMALAGALGTGDALLGALFMFIFGLGTLPMMLGLSLAGNMLSLSIRQTFTKAVPYVVGFMGLLFILRGLDLGIPFLSPPTEKLTPAAHEQPMQALPAASDHLQGHCCQPK